MASIVFTDAEGTVTLTNGKPAPANRFANWVPFSVGIGPRYAQLDDGVPRKWVHRYDYGARFELHHIPHTKQRHLLRLMLWLEDGGLVTVNTQDLDANSYPCYVAPDEPPSVIEQMDREFIEYRLSLALINGDANPWHMLCYYAAAES